MSLSLLQTLHETGTGQFNPGFGSYSLDRTNKVLYVVYNNFNTFDGLGIEIDKIDCSGTLTVVNSARYAAYSQAVLAYFSSSENALYVTAENVAGTEGDVLKIDGSTLSILNTIRYDNHVIPPGATYRYYSGAAALDTVNGFYYLAVSTHSDTFVFDCTDFDPSNPNVYQFIVKIRTGSSPAWDSTTQLLQTYNGIATMSMDNTNNFLWAGLYQKPGVVVKINTPGLTINSSAAFPNDNSFNNVCGMTVMPSSGYGFCQSDAEQPNVGRIARFSLSTITPFSTLDLPTWSFTTGNAPISNLCGNATVPDSGNTYVYFTLLPAFSDNVNQCQALEITPNPLAFNSTVDLGLPTDGFYLPTILYNTEARVYSLRSDSTDGSTDVLQLGSAINTIRGVNIRQTGTQLIFRELLLEASGFLVTTGTTNLYLYEYQSDGSFKSYDWSDNTFKTGALGAETVIMTHQKGNDNTTNTGVWTYTLATLTGFTVGAIYLMRVSNSTTDPTNIYREFQYGSLEGDIILAKNYPIDNFEFVMISSVNHITPTPGLTVTATRSIDGGAFAACANAVSGVSNGTYRINLAASDLNGSVITLRFTAVGGDDRFITVIT